MQSVLIIAPVIFPCGGDTRYQGIERLCLYWGCELHRLGYKASVVSARGSVFPRGITHIEVPLGDFTQGELVAYASYKPEIRNYDVILEMSHSHWAMREFTDLPAVAWCWHTPALMQPPLPSYNLFALSEYQKNQLFAYQGLTARVFDPHCGRHWGEVGLEPSPGTEKEEKEAVGGGISNYYVFIGRATPTKGMLEAVRMCKNNSLPLRIIGGLGPNDDPAYLYQVEAECCGDIEYLGQVSDEVKNHFLSRAKALIYPINYPNQYGESHSHKSVDSLLAGIPVVAYRQGALDEVIEHGVDGFLAANEHEFVDYMLEVDSLDRDTIRRRATGRWSIENVVSRAIPVLDEVAGGLRW